MGSKALWTVGILTVGTAGVLILNSKKVKRETMDALVRGISRMVFRSVFRTVRNTIGYKPQIRPD